MCDWGPLLRNTVRQRLAEGSGILFLALDDIWSGTQSQFQSPNNPHLLKDYFFYCFPKSSLVFEVLL